MSTEDPALPSASSLQSLRIEGEMTIYRAEELCIGFKEALAAGGDIEVNLSEVTEMDSAGVQLLIATKKAAGALQRELRLVEHSPAVLEVFEMLNLNMHLGVPLPA
jgi:anti-sigma B factor antagonist